MAKLILVSGSEAVKKFKKAGWGADRQRGSHVMMVKSGFAWTLSVPQHPELGPGLLKKLLKQAEIPIEEFNKL